MSKRFLFLAVACVLLIGGCAEPPPRLELAEFHGQVVANSPFVVLPNRAWREHPERPVWFFGEAASMLCLVRETPAEDVVFAFVPEDPERSLDYEILWNGEEIGSVAHQPTGAPSPETHFPGELQVPIPPEMLTPGLHHLTLRRHAEAPEQGEPTPETFLYIGYRHDGKPYPLDVEHRLMWTYLANLLDFGVTGTSGAEGFGGAAFKGPQRARLDLGSNRGGEIRFELQNASYSAARFHVRAGDAVETVRLRTHERGPLRLEIPPGVGEIELEAEGEANGFYLWGAPHFEARGAPKRPPIVLITLDTTRRDALGTYREDIHAGRSSETPHLDAFATEATVFERAYTTAPWTLPAHASLMTGLYPSRHGAGVVDDHLAPRFATLAELLASRGYLGAGFAGGTLCSARFGIAQGFGIYREPQSFEILGAELTEMALGALEEHGDVPLFLFLNYFDPHFPFRPEGDGEDGERLDHETPASEPGLLDELLDGSSGVWMDLITQRRALDAAERVTLRDAYRAEIVRTDHEVGRIFAALRERGLYDEALIVITADHGELLGEGGYYSHSSRLDGLLVEVPLLIKWPRQSQAERRTELVSLVDLFPTILRAAGVPPPPSDGLTLVPPGLDAPAERAVLAQRSIVVMEEHDAGFHRLFESMRLADNLYGFQREARRHLRWQEAASLHELCLVPSAEGLSEGLEAAELDCPPAPELDRLLADLRAATEARGGGQRIGLSTEEREKLRSLGYLQ